MPVENIKTEVEGITKSIALISEKISRINEKHNELIEEKKKLVVEKKTLEIELKRKKYNYEKFLSNNTENSLSIYFSKNDFEILLSGLNKNDKSSLILSIDESNDYLIRNLNNNQLAAIYFIDVKKININTVSSILKLTPGRVRQILSEANKILRRPKVKSGFIK